MARRWPNAYHDWTIGGQLKARINTRPRAEGYPRTHLEKVTGWLSHPTHDEPTEDKPSGRRGAFPHPRTSRDKTMVYDLQQQALTEDDLTASLAELAGAFADHSSEGILICTPWPGHGDDVWATYAQVSDYSGDGELLYTRRNIAWPRTEWMADPQLSFDLRDGRWYWWNESGVLGQPMVYDDSDQAVLVDNNGQAPSDPLVTVAGVLDGDDVHLGRDAAGGDVGRSLWFRGCPAGDLVVDFAERTAVIGATDVTDLIDEAESDWWDAGVDAIPPGTGTNVWVGPGTPAATIAVSLFSASW